MSDKCNAPVIVKWKPTGKRCHKPLGPETTLYANNKALQGFDIPGPAGRECANGHFSLKCPKCGVTDFAISQYPKGYHETFIGNYWCRHCRECIYSDEGLNQNMAEIVA